MDYSKESSLEVKKSIPLSSRMQQIKIILAEVEELKRNIVRTEFNERIPFAIKQKKLTEMRESLFLTEHIALKLVQDEIQAQVIPPPPKSEGR